MISLEPNTEHWLEHVLFEDVLPPRTWDYWVFDPHAKEQLKRQLPEGAKRRDYPHVYFSANRPLSFSWTRGLLDPGDCAIVTTKEGTKSYVACRELLDPDTLYRLELYPLLETRVDTLMSLLTQDDWPLAMAKLRGNDHVEVVVATPDSRHPDRWRVTFFEEEVGPTGHLEVPDQRGAIKEMLAHDFHKIASLSMLDDIARTFPKQTTS
jgi:hypothetical protein